MAAPNSFFVSSPSVLQPPSAPTEYFINGHYNDVHTSNPIANGVGGLNATPTGSLPVTPGSIAGRKRSRGDALAMDEDEHKDDDGSVLTPAAGVSAQPQGEAVLGPGMTLIHHDRPAYEARPESQSGTWVEERAQWNQFQLNPPQQQEEQRPAISTRKSQRVDSGAAATAGSDHLAQLVLPPQMREVTTEPLIDEATRTLGISWTRMDSTEPLRISQAAYTKWIQNHYPALKDVAIWFENSAIPGYLVEAQNAYLNQKAYYIVSQDLTEARLVTSDPSQLIPRLQMLPALELAAPGGCIRAEAESIVPDRPKATPSSWHRVQQSEDYSMSSYARLLRGFSDSPSQDVDMG